MNKKEIDFKKLFELTLKQDELLDSRAGCEEILELYQSQTNAELAAVFENKKITHLFPENQELRNFADELELAISDKTILSTSHVKIETNKSSTCYGFPTKNQEKWLLLIFERDLSPETISGLGRLIRKLHYTEPSKKKSIQEYHLQDAMIDMAASFINIDFANIIPAINEALERMGLLVSADRAYIFDYLFDEQITNNTYEWCNEGITPEIENLQNLPLSMIPEFVEHHKKGETLYVPRVEDLDPESGLKELLASQSIKSLIAVPMMDGKELLGFVGFDSVKRYYDYSENEKQLLLLFAQLLINVRKRKHYENRLLIQEEKFRNIIVNMNMGLLENDLEDRIVFANQSFCELSGYTLEEIKGKKAVDIFLDGEDRKIIQDKHKLRLNGISDSYEIKIKDKHGKVRWWFISGAPHYNDKGQLIGSLGMHLDITAQKELEIELANAKNEAERAAKARELFLANMSHEIRTPLNVIIGMLRQFKTEDLKKVQRQYLTHAQSSANHLLTILNNILDLAKIESGEIELRSEPFSPSALVYNLQSIMVSQVTEKQLFFDVDIHPKIQPVLLGDETRLRQVLINLISNAIKFTSEGGISLKVDLIDETKETQVIQFQVKDTGIGMSQEFLSKIFDQFTQEHNAYNKKFEGTGLGMSISNELLNVMGSEIIIESELDKGTCCSFSLSLPIGEIKEINLPKPLNQKDYFKGKSALLVEDNPMNRLIAKNSLLYLGFQTKEAENGLQAVELLKKEKFDVILMDVQMPKMDGIQATKIIKNELKLSTPVIAITANAFKKDLDLYLSQGMSEYITKPYDEQDFFQKLNKVLHHRNQSSKYQSDRHANTPSAPQFDLSWTSKLNGRANEEIRSQVLSLFQTIAHESIQEIQYALVHENLELAQKTIHKIKPNIYQFKIQSLYDVLESIHNHPIHEGFNNEFKENLETFNSVLSATLEQLDIEDKG